MENSTVFSSRKSTLNIFKEIYRNLSIRRKRQLKILLLLMLINGITEVFSIAAVIPLLTFLVNPDTPIQSSFISNFQELFSINISSQPFFVSFVFILATLISLLARIITLFISTRLSASIGSDLSIKCFDRTLSQNFESFIKRDSSEIIAGNSIQINQTVLALYLALQMITLIIVSFSIILSLLAININITLLITIFFSVSYLVISLLFKSQLTKNSKKIAKKTKSQISAIKDGLGSFREIILDSSKLFFLNQYSKVDIPLRRLQANNQFLASSPRYILESIGILFICLVSLKVSLKSEVGINLIPLIGTFALAAQKLLPTVNRIYICWSGIMSRKSEMQCVLELLNQKIYYSNHSKGLDNDFIFEKLILKNIEFNYEEDNKKIIDNVSFSIYKGDKVGLIGSSGEGKSTLVNIIIGLLKPTKGEIFVNNKSIYDPENESILKAWRMAISSVPQDIFLMNASFAKNIAFGKSQESINFEKLEDAGKRARIHSFINKFDEKYNKVIGEDGSSLSGGQKQRIGLARAFYKNSDLLILDESTNALDNITEKEIFETINAYDRNITTITISHKLENLTSCNKVFEIKKGTIKKINLRSLKNNI